MISKKEHAAISSAIKAKRCPNFFTRLGGQIEIHGMGSGTDWTWGCVALDNPDIEELYRALPNGTRVVIKP
jgi:lipoprotein-anchoring transpeptidase ErfK/SrfK